MNVGLGEDGAPHITYTPRSGADFKPVDIIIPPLETIRYTTDDVMRPDLAVEKVSDEVRFRAEAEAKVRDCCGAAICKANVNLAVSGLVGQPNLRIVAGATLNCDMPSCPLIDPPESGDRETLSPVPNPPALAAELNL